MKKFIYHLRRQPEEVRTQILHFLTVVAGVILFSLWVYSLGTGLSSEETQVKVKNDLEPFSALKAKFYLFIR